MHRFHPAWLRILPERYPDSGNGGSAEIQNAESTKLITEKEAKEIALEKVNGIITEVDFDQDDNHPHYEFEIQSNSEEVNIDVDAKTGKATITDRDKAEKYNDSTKPVKTNETASTEQDVDDQDDDVKAENPSATKQNDAVATNQTTQNKAAETQTTKPTAGTTQKEIITKAEAIKIASTVAKGTVTNVELDRDDDDKTSKYELEFKDGNVEYDVEVDAYTGNIIEVDQDVED